MRRLALATLFLLVCPIALAQMLCHAATPSPGGISPCAKELAAAVSQQEFQKVYWPALMDKLTDEKNPGLPFFRQGMTQYYGLNYEEAMRNFKEAKKDPSMAAMASWGIALAAGPNINLNMTGACNLLACDEIKCADSLAGGVKKEGCEPKASTTPLEKELIAALKKRYVCLMNQLSEKEAEDAAGKAAEAYSNAMADISKQHPDDKNVSTLYAESMMNLHPWDLYDKAGLPKRKQTDTIVDVLKKSTGNSLEAIGANHYYIHAIEGSADLREKESTQQAARQSADLLQTQVTQSGHLVHMSSHIYLLLGKYRASLDANVKAVANDVGQYGDACRSAYETYKTNSRCPQLYYGHYLSHNYFFGSVSATFTGQSKEAAKLACATSAHVERFVIYEPGLQRYMTAPLMTLVVNRNWDKIMKYPEPPKDCYRQPPFNEDSGCHIVRSIWYWARGMAHATRGDTGAASMDFKNMKDEEGKIQKQPPSTWGNNEAFKVLNIADSILIARINWPNKQDATFVSLTTAIKYEDDLSYDEPPQWFTPAREALGGAYLQAEQYDQALVVFEKALDLHPASGRALYGKVRALQGLHAPQEKIDNIIKNEYCPAWQYADYTMTDDDLWPAMRGEGKGVEQITCPAREKKVSKPSECTCPLPKWPPVGVADLPVDKLECAN